MLTPDNKAQLLSRFSTYLESVESNTIEAETASVDLYSFYTALTALKSEVKAESRQVKGAIDNFKTVIDLLQSNNQQLIAEREQQQQADSAAQQRIETPLLQELLELRDRIAAGAQEAKAYKAPWYHRNAESHSLALHEGMAITLRRLDALLSRYHVTPIETLGNTFDPHQMNVVATEQQAGHEEGIVLTEQRKGYRRHGTLFRVAEVIVNKREEK